MLVRLRDVGRAELGAEIVQLRAALQRPRGGRPRRHAAADRERARRLRAGDQRAAAAVGALPAGDEVPGRLRQHDGGVGVDSRGALHAPRGDRPRRSRDVRVPPGLAQRRSSPLSRSRSRSSARSPSCALFGFSINTLTLFGITLATGLVVDDAIVVVENVQRHLHEYGTGPRESASAAMAEVVGPVIATALVLAAVFVPVALFPGNDRAAVPAVRADDRLLGGDLGVQRAHADAVALGPAAAGRAASEPVLGAGQLGHRRAAPRLRLRRHPPRAVVQVAVVVVFLAGLWANVVGGHRTSRPASCPTRIRAASS